MKRIVIKIPMETDKCKIKAFIVAAKTGPQSISLEGEGNNEVVVTGEVDAAYLFNKMRKKLRCAELLSVQNVTDSDEKEEDKGEEDENTSKENDVPPCQLCPCTTFQPSIIHPIHAYYDPYPNGCSIV